MTNYKRISVVVEGPEKGPFEITFNKINMQNGKLSTEAESVVAESYTLDWSLKRGPTPS